MFAVGLILVVLALIVVVYVMFATGGLEPMSIDWGVFTADLTPLQLFFLGAVTIVVMAIGVVMLSIGLKKQGEKRAEVKRLRKDLEKVQSDQPDSGGDASASTVKMDKSSTGKSAQSSGKGPATGSTDARSDTSASGKSSGSGAVPSRRAGTGGSATGSSTTGGASGDGPASPTTPPPRR